MSNVYDCSVDSELLTGMRLARTTLGRGELVVLPTDTVYGIAADAFNPAAVQRLLDAKGRTRQQPPPVLVSGTDTLTALASVVPELVTRLVEEFWPGGLTVILPAQQSLVWDLGETDGTVALRMPDNEITLELLRESGPLAVSSANKTGLAPAESAAAAHEMLGDSVGIYLDAGNGKSVPSTIVDATALTVDDGQATILREGVISLEQLREILGDRLAND
ncbi:L-threonylcarbamoyladenylate synthase [Paramicrobacterium chengjingii]|uniref:L-threonylcarbamoyladenylate synthase n=1 Tax=Paramicrobacterium chengjingii TaxID=2769067 RepID=UPI001423F7F5|nr:L-threonylcarbamoyladenylate synthase [Microbacterium chengjingii]